MTGLSRVIPRPLILFNLALFMTVGGCSRNPIEKTSLPAQPQPETPEDSAQNLPTVKKIYELGEAFAIRDEQTDVVMSFSSTRTHRGEEFLKPKEGHQWFYLKGTITNNRDEAFLISPEFYTLTDSNKKDYTPSPRAQALEGIQVLQGQIQAQSTQTGEIGFEIPKESKPVLLSFDLSNATACNDKILRPSFFCKPILINLTDGRG